MIKAVFFDVDGTLVSHTSGTVPDSTRAALDLLSEMGIQRVVATGRSLMELAFLPVKDIVFDAYVLMNGQLCLDAQRKIIAENPISGADKALPLLTDVCWVRWDTASAGITVFTRMFPVNMI